MITGLLPVIFNVIMFIKQSIDCSLKEAEINLEELN